MCTLIHTGIAHVHRHMQDICTQACMHIHDTSTHIRALIHMHGMCTLIHTYMTCTQTQICTNISMCTHMHDMCTLISTYDTCTLIHMHGMCTHMHGTCTHSDTLHTHSQRHINDTYSDTDAHTCTHTGVTYCHRLMESTFLRFLSTSPLT